MIAAAERDRDAKVSENPPEDLDMLDEMPEGEEEETGEDDPEKDE